jgi:perosamine synthetase
VAAGTDEHPSGGRTMTQQPIFNSLGSNYDHRFIELARQQLFAPAASTSTLSTHIKAQLSAELNADKGLLVYKGRDAIELALRGLGVGEADQVLTQAFTCHAIEEAIIRVGAEPVYVDVSASTWNPGLDQLTAALKGSSRVRALIIQHTLGMPADLAKIRKWCQQHNIFLIEDLAQAVGGTDHSGKPLGASADVVVFSFGRDKIIDAVSGGAVFFTDVAAFEKANHYLEKNEEKLSSIARWQDLSYPVITNLVKKHWQSGLGKVLMLLGQKLGWLRNPIVSPTDGAGFLPSQYWPLLAYQLDQLDANLKHRREIAHFYLDRLSKIKSPLVLLVSTKQSVDRGSNQRFQIWVEQPSELITWLAQHQVYVSDRWYRKPVDFGSLPRQTVYRLGSCPNAEELARHILNLPTHPQLTLADADRVVTLIESYVTSHH